jgi:cobalt-zinc-cadmium efflux system outer membrane protein
MRQWIIYTLFVFSSASFADNAQTRNKLTLNQAIINVLENSPMLKAADYESRAAAARIRSAQLSPGYRTSIEFENFGGSGDNNGSDRLESTLSLSKVLELGDKAKLRGDLSHGKAMLLRNEQDSKRLDLLADTTKHFIQVIIDQESIVIAKDSLALAKRTQKTVGQRVKAGKSPNAELRRAKIALARSELELDHTEHSLASSRLKLATLWGETNAYFTTADANLFKVEITESFEALVKLLENNPDLVKYASEKRLANTRSLLAKSSGQSDIEISGGLRHFNATDDTAFVLSLDIPLGSSSRASSKIEEAEILSLRDPYVYEQRRLVLYATLFEVHQEIKHAVDALKALREKIIPLAELALKDYEKGYAAGRYSFFELTEAQRVLLDSRLEAVMTAADYHRYRIEIDRLTGAGLTTGVSP